MLIDRATLRCGRSAPRPRPPAPLGPEVDLRAPPRGSPCVFRTTDGLRHAILLRFERFHLRRHYLQLDLWLMLSRCLQGAP